MKYLYPAHLSFVMFGALCLVLTACHRDPMSPATSAVADGPAASMSKNASNTTTPSERSKIAPTDVRSFTSTMQDLSAKQQVEVNEWYRRTGAPPMSGSTPEQIEWMRARGYPMPEDVVRAGTMSDWDLKAAADTGDTTAKVLYAARQLHNQSEDPALDMDSDQQTVRNILAATRFDAAIEGILASGSPYAGYLWSERKRMVSHEGGGTDLAPDELAGLVWASKFGDTRANRLLDTPTVQAMSAVTASYVLGTMLQTALHANPKLFLTPVVPIPPPDQ